MKFVTRVFLLFILLITKAHAEDRLLELNESWLYENKARSIKAIRDITHESHLLAVNIVFASWEVRDGSYTRSFAPFLAELIASRPDDAFFYFQNRESEFEDWLELQERFLFYDLIGSSDLVYLEELHGRVISSLEAYLTESKREWKGTKMARRYLDRLNEFTVPELNSNKEL